MGGKLGSGTEGWGWAKVGSGIGEKLVSGTEGWGWAKLGSGMGGKLGAGVSAGAGASSGAGTGFSSGGTKVGAASGAGLTFSSGGTKLGAASGAETGFGSGTAKFGMGVSAGALGWGGAKFGMGADTGAAAGVGAASSFVPQRLQNLVPGLQRFPQLGQSRTLGSAGGAGGVWTGIFVPQRLQKAALLATSALQFGQIAMPRRTLIWSLWRPIRSMASSTALTWTA